MGCYVYGEGMAVSDEEERIRDKIIYTCPLTEQGRFVTLIPEGIWT
jgi:hypothetical protein